MGHIGPYTGPEIGPYFGFHFPFMGCPILPRGKAVLVFIGAEMLGNEKAADNEETADNKETTDCQKSSG